MAKISTDTSLFNFVFGIRFFLITTILLASMVAWAEEMAVIVNPNNGVGELTLQDVKNLYLGRHKTFGTEIKAKPFTLIDDAHLRNDFLTMATNKTPKQLESYWAYLIFSGEGEPPQRVASYETMLEMVAANDGGIGYLPKRLVDDSLVKVVLTVNLK